MLDIHEWPMDEYFTDEAHLLAYVDYVVDHGSGSVVKREVVSCPHCSRPSIHGKVVYGEESWVDAVANPKVLSIISSVSSGRQAPAVSWCTNNKRTCTRDKYANHSKTEKSQICNCAMEILVSIGCQCGGD